MTQQTVTEKKILRKKMLELRDSIAPETGAKKSALITQKVTALSQFKNTEKVLCFVSYNSEVDTQGIIDAALKGGKKVYLPRICEAVDEQKKDEEKDRDKERVECTTESEPALKNSVSGKTMRFFEIKDMDSLETGFKGIREPKEDAKKEYVRSPHTFVLIPGLAFDDEGTRLGYGGGFYDRFIASLESVEDVCLCAVAYSEQVLPVGVIPSEEHDLKIPMLVTD